VGPTVQLFLGHGNPYTGGSCGNQGQGCGTYVAIMNGIGPGALYGVLISRVSGLGTLSGCLRVGLDWDFRKSARRRLRHQPQLLQRPRLLRTSQKRRLVPSDCSVHWSASLLVLCCFRGACRCSCGRCCCACVSSFGCRSTQSAAERERLLVRTDHLLFALLVCAVLYPRL